MSKIKRIKVAAVVLNYKKTKDTQECIESLKKCSLGDLDLKIIIVNNSPEENLKKLASSLDILLINNDKNLGYSGGMNVGIKKALEEKSDFVLLLNNDTYFDKGFLKNLLTNVKPDVIVSPKIYFAKGYEFHKDRYTKNQIGKVIWYAGGKIDWENIIGIHMGVDEVDRGQFNKKLNITLATGCCMLVPRKVFEKIGTLDDDYFLYLEDMDFSVRAKKAGFEISYDPSSIMWHKNASSIGGSGSSLQNYYICRNRLIFAFRYAKTRTKIALLRHFVSKLGEASTRKAVLDFLTHNYGQQK